MNFSEPPNRYYGEAIYKSDYGEIKIDHRTTATSLTNCEGRTHRFDIDSKGNVAVVCRCGGKKRSQAK